MFILTLIGGLLVLGFVVGLPVAALSARSLALRLERELKGVKGRLAEVEARLAELQRPPEALPAEAPPPEPVTVAAMAPPPPIAIDVPRPKPAKPMGTEKALTERWLVWLGGITLALGGAFLVKFSVEQGLLGPAVRVSLGGLAGLATMVLGHVLTRTRIADRTWHLPSVLVGAGASMVFASLFAAYALYHFLDPMLAFAGLGLVAAATVLLSLAHGPFVAMLGLAGGFAVPLLVRTAEPNALGLFAYLLALAAGTLALLRWRQWWWLAWMTLGGTAGWVLLWLITAYRLGDELVLGVFLVALAALFAAFRLGIPAVAAFAQRAEAPMVRQVILVAGGVIAATALAVISVADFSASALALLFALELGYLAFAWRDQEFDRLPYLAAVMAVAVLASWDAGLPEIGQFTDILGRPLPHEAERFAWVAALSAALFGAAGFAAAERGQRPPRWAAVSVGAPLAILAATYWRLHSTAGGWLWTGGALALGLAFLLAAERINRRRGEEGMDGALGAYAVGVVGAMALAATIAFEEAWLTVTLSLLVAGTAWIESRLRIAELRKVALVLACVILVRLGLNPYVLDYHIAGPSAFNWLLYGYGIPLAAFLAAARLFRASADDVLVQVLEAGAIAFAVLLVSLEIRHLMAGGLGYGAGYSLTEQSLHSIAWLSGAAVLLAIHRRNGRLVPLRGAQVLAVLATVQVVLLQSLMQNPLLTGASMGERVILDPLLLAFAAPAALYGLLARLAPRSPPWDKPACVALALALGFLWAMLETRHAFAGANLRLGAVGQAEMWAYSVVALLGGVAVLSGGIRFGSAILRHTGLAVVMLVVVKVFLVDLSRTSGLWRALSFLGLGAALMGIGWLYRRFVRLEDTTP